MIGYLESWLSYCLGLSGHMQSKGILVNIDSEVYEIKSVTCENSKVTF